jgi:1-aminocyclopropane-1-carboxylate deaminase
VYPFSLPTVRIDKVNSATAAAKNCTLAVLRLDEIDKDISGNKIFKLRYYLEEAIRQKKKGIITWGGAYSNHIAATAAACASNQLASVGLIRGEAPPELSHTLKRAGEYGMQFIFISRDEYKQKKLPVAVDTSDYVLVNEGGFGAEGARGAEGIAACFSQEAFTHVLCAVGTGTTLAGLRNALPQQMNVTGISVMKNNPELDVMVRSLLTDKNAALTILHDYHFGGYAKYRKELISFMNHWYRLYAIPSDFVYTGKLFYAAEDLLQKDFFPPDSKILVIHSGGLQGNLSLDKGTLIF